MLTYFYLGYWDQNLYWIDHRWYPYIINCFPSPSVYIIICCESHIMSFGAVSVCIDRYDMIYVRWYFEQHVTVINNSSPSAISGYHWWSIQYKFWLHINFLVRWSQDNMSNRSKYVLQSYGTALMSCTSLQKKVCDILCMELYTSC